MKLIDADALLATLLYRRPFNDDKGVGKPEFRAFVDGCVQLLDAAPTLRCDGCAHGKDNHTYIPTFWCHKHQSQVYPHESCSRWQPSEGGGE